MGHGRIKVTFLKPTWARQPTWPPGSPRAAAAISSATLQWWARRDSHGDKAPGGLSLGTDCFWLKSPCPQKAVQEQAQELPGRPPILGDPWAGKQRPLCNAFCWGWVELFVFMCVRARRGRGGRETKKGEGMCDRERMRWYLSRDPGSRRLFNTKECETWSPDISMTRNCSLSGAVTSAGFECMKPAPK